MASLENELIRLSLMRFGRRVSTGVKHETHAAMDKLTICYPPYAQHDPILEILRNRIPKSHISVERIPAESHVEELNSRVSRETQKVSFLAKPEQVATLAGDIAYARLEMSRRRWR